MKGIGCNFSLELTLALQDNFFDFGILPIAGIVRFNATVCKTVCGEENLDGIRPGGVFFLKMMPTLDFK